MILGIPSKQRLEFGKPFGFCEEKLNSNSDVMIIHEKWA